MQSIVQTLVSIARCFSAQARDDRLAEADRFERVASLVLLALLCTTLAALGWGRERLAADRFQPERRDQLHEAAQLERTDLVGLHELGHGGLGLRVEDDLAGVRVTAEARREVRHVADRGVLPAVLEADHAERRLALRDADAQADGVP